jgi:hypothetical protein
LQQEPSAVHGQLHLEFTSGDHRCKHPSRPSRAPSPAVKKGLSQSHESGGILSRWSANWDRNDFRWWWIKSTLTRNGLGEARSLKLRPRLRPGSGPGGGTVRLSGGTVRLRGGPSTVAASSQPRCQCAASKVRVCGQQRRPSLAACQCQWAPGPGPGRPGPGRTHCAPGSARTQSRRPAAGPGLHSRTVALARRRHCPAGPGLGQPQLLTPAGPLSPCSRGSPRPVGGPLARTQSEDGVTVARRPRSYSESQSLSALRNGRSESASRRGLRVTICPSHVSRAVTIGSGLVDMIGTSLLGDMTAGISDPCR